MEVTVARLLTLYGIATTLCAMMVFWVSFAPGSCTTSFIAAKTTRKGLHEVYEDKLDSWSRVVPHSLVTKYRENGLVCMLHVLPSVLWSGLAPLQLNQWIRKHRPRLHRRVGRILIAVSASMTAGYVLIHVRGLHFHTNDFSTLKQGEGLSVLAPWFWPFLGRCMHSCTFGMTGSKDPAAFAFVTFETCAAIYWLVTAGMAGYYAWKGRGNATVAQKICMSRHRSWAIRHVAAGLSVATQRVFIGASHGWCRYQSLRCEDAAAQKGIFADSLTLGVLACLTLGEIAIWDSRSKVALDTRSKAD